MMLNKYPVIKHIVFLTFIVFCNEGFGQINHPRISPQTSLVQSVGLTEVTISYSRPSARGRKVFDGIVPFGRIWRLGANESTHITFQDSVSILGNKLPPRTYALYAIPQKEKWVIIFHKNLNLWGDGRDLYNVQEDALRITVASHYFREFTETLTIEMNCLTHDNGVLEIYWENTRVSIPLVWNTQQKMIDEIQEQVVKNPTAQTFYEAARYYQETGIFPQKSLLYLDKSEKIGGEKYFISRIRSLVYASLNNYSRAILEAERSQAMAKSLGKDEFVRMNTENIEKWKALE